MLLSFVKVSTYIFNHAFLDLLFGRKRTCHHYECAECTKNYHCSGNQYCSGYTCVSEYKYSDYTTQRPWTTSRPLYSDWKDPCIYNPNKCDLFGFATPKSWNSNYDSYTQSNYDNYDFTFNTPNVPIAAPPKPFS